MKNLKLQWIDKIPPPEERNPELFYYDIRNSEIDNGYTVERGVLANNIGSLVTNKDILGDKKFITDFYKYSLVSIVLNWIDNGMHENPELIVAKVSSLITGTIDYACLSVN